MILPLNKRLVIIPLLLGTIIVLLTLWHAQTTEARAIYQAAKSFAQSLKIYRQYYSEVILKNLAGNDAILITHKIEENPGSLPIPATMTKTLATLMQHENKDMGFTIASPYPFLHQKTQGMSALQQRALEQFKQKNVSEFTHISKTDGVKHLHFITPVIMEENCVNCHNTHPDSPKKDWTVGDIRGVEEVVVSFPRFDPARQMGLITLIALLIIAWSTATIIFLRMARRNKHSFDAVIASEKRLTETNQQLLLAKEKAEQSAKAKAQFLAMMSHELRTPLNGIEGMAQLLKTTQLTAEQADYAHSIEESSIGLLAVIQDILDLSQSSSGKLSVNHAAFSPAALFDNIYSLFQHHCEQKGLTLRLALNPSVPNTLCSDETKVRQITINLIGNAIKFTESGTIDVDVTLVDASDGFFLQVTVTDTGMGIAAEKIPKIFEDFVQLDQSSTRRFEGSGLGLSICKSLVDLLKGRLSVESEPGEGSRFWFLIPVTLVEDTPNETPLPPPPSHNEKTESAPLRILVAEDNAVNQKVIAAMLKKLGHQHIIVDDGQQAIDVLETETIDLVFMDLQMPVLDGLAATRAIRHSQQKYAEVPIIALTANVSLNDRTNCNQVGMNGFVAKPINMDSLNQEISRLTAEITHYHSA